MNIDFLCVGLPKCGTTTLDTIMRQEKQIQLPVIKEPRLFMDKQDFNEIEVSNHHFKWWFMISPPKGYVTARP